MLNKRERESTKKHFFWGTGKTIKKDDLEHKGEHQKDQKARSRARFLGRGSAPMSTLFGTRESIKKHAFAHEGERSKQRLPKKL
jgi:hypothetical protein